MGVWRAAARLPAIMALVSESRGRELDESTVVVEWLGEGPRRGELEFTDNVCRAGLSCCSGGRSDSASEVEAISALTGEPGLGDCVEDAETNVSFDEAESCEDDVVGRPVLTRCLLVGGLVSFLGVGGLGRLVSEPDRGTSDELELEDLSGNPGGLRIGFRPILLGSGEATSVATRRTTWGGVTGR